MNIVVKQSCVFFVELLNIVNFVNGVYSTIMSDVTTGLKCFVCTLYILYYVESC